MNIDYPFIAKAFPDIASYIPTTLKLALTSFLIAFPLGVLIALINHKKIRLLSPIAALYLSLIRGTPVILQIYVIYNIGPYILASYLEKIGSHIDVYEIDNIYYAFLALSLPATASIAEAIRAGLGAVDKGQYEAALSVGMSATEAFFCIVFPQALAMSMPVVCNAIVNLMKSTSLAFMMAVADVTGRAKIIGGAQLRYFEAYIDVFLIYIVLVASVEQLVKMAERRMTLYKRIGRRENKKIKFIKTT